jgi:hypothetical protein
MLGALAWQVTHSNEKVLLLFGGDRMGNFFSPRFSLPVPVCLSLSLSLSLYPFSFKFSSQSTW